MIAIVNWMLTTGQGAKAIFTYYHVLYIWGRYYHPHFLQWKKLRFRNSNCLVAKLCLTLLQSMDCSPPVSSVHGISWTSILEWVAISLSRGYFQLRDRTCVPWTAGDSLSLTHLGNPEMPIPLSKIKQVLSNLAGSQTRVVWIENHAVYHHT